MRASYMSVNRVDLQQAVNFKNEKFFKHFFFNCSDPILADSIDAFQSLLVRADSECAQTTHVVC